VLMHDAATKGTNRRCTWSRLISYRNGQLNYCLLM